MVNPDAIKYRILHPQHFKGTHPQQRRACIQGGSWDFQRVDILEEKLKYQGLADRIKLDIDWANTDLFREASDTIASGGLSDGRSSIVELKERYKELDKLIQFAKKNGRLKFRYELDQQSFREMGGMPLLIGRDGELIFGRGGSHRFYIALLLGLARIPMSLEAIHPEFVTRFMSTDQFSKNAERMYQGCPSSMVFSEKNNSSCQDQT